LLQVIFEQIYDAKCTAFGLIYGSYSTFKRQKTKSISHQTKPCNGMIGEVLQKQIIKHIERRVGDRYELELSRQFHEIIFSRLGKLSWSDPKSLIRQG
jgi:hypothetical protein